MSTLNNPANHESRLMQAIPIMQIIESTDLLPAIDRSYGGGRRGYPTWALFRPYALLFLMGFGRENDLLRLLDENPMAEIICGLKDRPHRTTHKRFINRLIDFQTNIDDAITDLVCRLKAHRPDLGQVVAIDSTDVRTYSHPYRNGGDPTANWGVKTSLKDKNGKTHTEQFYGFKMHLVADATHGVPLHYIVTPGNHHDSPTLEPMVKDLLKRYEWMAPEVLVGDRGYDSTPNFKFLWNEGIHPVLKIRDLSRGKLKYFRYDKDGVPHCRLDTKMWYLETDPERGFHYLCPDSSAAHQCEGEHWVNPMRDIRLFGTICRVSPEWKQYYGMRYAIERIFKLMKGSHRLKHHTVSGIDNIRVHVSMSTLVFLATVLNNLQNGDDCSLNKMVPTVP